MLENIHRFSLENLEEQEMLWVCSMLTCPLHPDTEIPLAQYGIIEYRQDETLYRSGCTIDTAVSCRSRLACTTISPCQTHSGSPSKKFAGAKNLKDSKPSRYLHRSETFTDSPGCWSICSVHLRRPAMLRSGPGTLAGRI